MGIAGKIIQNQDREGMLRRSLERIIQLYTDKSHFVYELLQNAEDSGAKNIKFIQYSDRLEVLHDGKPFTQANLQSLCDIGKSDKTEDLNQIGEFGVGFKSVFGICDTVKLYSSPKNYHGQTDAVYESFAIEIQNFTLPVDIEYQMVPTAYTTRFIFPYHLGFNFSGFKSIPDLNRALTSRLKNLGITTLLFMRYLESIEYEIRTDDKVSSGVYLLQKTPINDHCSLISALGETGSKEETLSYLKFSRVIDDKVINRTVDIAFPVTIEKAGTYLFKEAESPFISVYFPTETESKLKFIVQGPYRTTPNRSSVPSDEPENITLSKITATLLKDSIKELRDRNQINLSFLKILPIDEDAFRAYDLFEPLYDTVKTLLSGEQMLPCRSGGYVSANQARIARNQNLPEIFDDLLFTSLINEKNHEYKWLSTELTETSKQYKKLYEYLTDVLDITVVRPEDLRTMFNENPEFLKARSNEWLIRMYGMYDSIPNVFSKNRYGTNMLTASFIKTDSGDFVAPYRKDTDGNYLQNVFLPSQKPYSSLDIAFLNGYMFSQCQHFFKEILGLQAPKEYDLFIKDYCSRTMSNKEIDDAEHISDIKTLLHYRNSSDYGSDILGIIREHLKFVCRYKGNTVYANPYKVKVLFPKTKSNIAIEAYYRGIAEFTYIDYDFYVSRGIDFDSLAQLNVSEKIVTHDFETSGEYYTGNPGKQPHWTTYGAFKWKLSFDRVNDVLESIAKNPTAPDSMAKSQTIFKLLQENEERLEGTVYIGGSARNIDPAYSEIITTLTQNVLRYNSNWNGKWLYTESNELVASTAISKSDLNNNIYGNPRPDSKLYRLLNFKKDASDKWEETIKAYDQIPDEKKNSFFELELQRRYGISDADLKAQFGGTGSTGSGSETGPIDESKYEFPTNQVKNWDSLKKHATEMFAFARPVQYEYLLRRIRTSNPNTSRTYLMGHYKAYGAYKYACQMCHEFYPNVDACQIEAHPKDELEPLYVLLCPNCTRSFQALRRNNYVYSNFMNELQSITHEKIETEDPVKVEFGDCDIWFTQTHIAEISELMRLRKTVEEENPDPTKPAIPTSGMSIKPANSSFRPQTTMPQNQKNTTAKLTMEKQKTADTPNSGIDYVHSRGKKVRHKTMGSGIVMYCDSSVLKVQFMSGSRTGQTVSFGIDACVKGNMFSLVE